MARTTSELDADLLKQAISLSAGKSGDQVAEDALRDYIVRRRQGIVLDKLVSRQNRWTITEEAAAAFWEERRKGREQARQRAEIPAPPPSPAT